MTDRGHESQLCDPSALRPAAAAEVLAKLHAWFTEYDRLRTDEVESPILAEIRYALGDDPDPPALAAGDAERDALLATLAARNGHVTGQLPAADAERYLVGPTRRHYVGRPTGYAWRDDGSHHSLCGVLAGDPVDVSVRPHLPLCERCRKIRA